MVQDGPGRVEWLTAGRPAGLGRARRRRLALALAVTVVAVAAGTGVLAVRNPGGTPSSAPVPSPPAAESRTAAPSPTSTAARRPPVTVSQVGPGLFGVRAGWELYGRAEAEVVRIEPARGRITRTRVPPLRSTGPVSFVVAGDVALVRPLDVVPGYAVPDVGPTRTLPEPLTYGVVLPGPEPGEVWAADFEHDRSYLKRVVVDGFTTVHTVLVHGQIYGALAADGAGGFVYPMDGSSYAYLAEGSRRVADGLLVAAGPRTWVTTNCRPHRCRPTVIDRRTARASELDVEVANRWMAGTVAPDGRYAAFSGVGVEPLQVLDLRNGEMWDPQVADGDTVWSPDGRLLFVAGSDGRLWLLEPSRRSAAVVGLDLPPLHQLAVEP